jgi:hypothetical protein
MTASALSQIVDPTRHDERSSAPLQISPISAREYLVAVSDYCLPHAIRHCLASPAEHDDGRCQAPPPRRGALSRISGTGASSPALLVLQWHRTRRPSAAGELIRGATTRR